jgi:hypothetical protein
MSKTFKFFARGNGVAVVGDPAYAKPKYSPNRARNAVPAGGTWQGIPDADESQLTFNRSPEVALNQKVKNLIQKLGEAIHESVSESENIAGVVKNIRDQGFDVMLMLEATIGLNQVEAEDEAIEAGGKDPLSTFTRNDLTFLKSLRITLPEEDAIDAGADDSSANPPAER